MPGVAMGSRLARFQDKDVTKAGGCMLQIATGKFFKAAVGRENRLRGVLYTNYRTSFEDEGLETAAGRLMPSSNLSGLKALIYEVSERYEGGPAEGALASVGAEPFLKDMAAVVSFGLDVTCTPDPDLARRLLSDAPLAPNAYARPKQYVARTFEAQVWGQPEEVEPLKAFVADLIALKREYYLGAMRAIRTYVGGLQRLGDDIDLAYTLLVASVESLAQGFDGHRATWGDYAVSKREAIDKALEDAPEAMADKVRDTLLDIEHVALTRRFRGYAMQTLKPAYFREDAAQRQNPIGRADLGGALDLAYRIRSKYVHELQAIPKPIVYVHDLSEWTRVDREIALTIQGLARLARTLILQFVQDSPKVDKEDYLYNLDIPGIVEVEMAPEYWVWKHEGFEPKQARLKLSGFLDLCANVLAKTPGAQLVDIRDLLAKFEILIPQAQPTHRRSMLSLYYLFNVLVAENQRREGWWDVVKGYTSILNAPSMESLSLLLVLRKPIDWTAKMLTEVRGQYYRQRYRELGLRLPWLLEAAFDLVLAEAHRREGDENEARAVIAGARDNHPTMAQLAMFEDQLLTPLAPIDWAEALLRKDEPSAAETPPSGDGLSDEAAGEDPFSR
ncbi:hypothetical protein BSY17_41 [Sphingobium sp. RAC03]|nr:hypothetical protein BSY17_41 [Sphingobium sp. RAC03]